ncbi:hypothetical protein ACDP63_10050 [Paracoccus sp. P2]
MMIAIRRQQGKDSADLLAMAIELTDRNPNCRVGLYALDDPPQKGAFYEFGNSAEFLAGFIRELGLEDAQDMDLNQPGVPAAKVTKILERKLSEAHAKIAYCRAYADGKALRDEDIDDLEWHIRGLLRQLSGFRDQIGRIAADGRPEAAPIRATARLIPFKGRASPQR